MYVMVSNISISKLQDKCINNPTLRYMYDHI